MVFELEDFAVGMEVPVHLAGRIAATGPFISRVPVDGAIPAQRTEVYLAYSRKALEVAFLAFDDEPDLVRANLSPRGNVFDDDNLNILIDTFADQRRAYMFLCNPLGIQFDAQFNEGGDFDANFEAVWRSDGRRTDQGYVVVMSIPFKSLRFPDVPEQRWRVMFNRSVPRNSEESYWPRYTNEIEGRLNQSADMHGIREIRPGRNIQIIPFSFLRNVNVLDRDAAAFARDDFDSDFGVDAKMVIRNSLVLDATINPDFSQVESDQPQITANQRFEVQFPEQRPFFLENADAFRTPINLVFTRRIVEPRVGAKLTGKRGPYQIGALLIDDESPVEAIGNPELADERATVGILRVNRDIANQSEVGVLLTDRELADAYNRVGAVDGRIKLNPNWVGNFQVASAATERLDGTELDGMAYNVSVDREGQHFNTHNHIVYTSPGFRTDLGFLGARQRPDAMDIHHRSSYRFRPVDSPFSEWGPAFFIRRIWDADGNPLDWTINPSFSWNWVGGMDVGLRYDRTNETLTPEGFPSLGQTTEFEQETWGVSFGSTEYSTIEFGAGLNVGERINFVPPSGEAPALADFFSASANALWRPLPALRIEMRYLHNELSALGGGGRIFRNDISRIQANWQFSKELSLRTILQHDRLDPDSERTRLTDNENLNIDLLVRYLWNPWTALYVGYNTNSSNFDLIDGPNGREVARTDGTLNRDGRQVFVKFSYLFNI
ncbi:hypothetical protein ABI59_07810 [Acidobacteria bacterium Mor1]|nr:hypothetical protein ABI59_07810 [Acidobacteria bacterium Mor1]